VAVVLVSAVDPYPTDAGKKVVLAGFVEYFQDRFGTDAVHYVLIGGQPRPEFPVRMHPLPRPNPVVALGHALTRVPCGRATLQESMLRSGRVAAAVSATLDRIQPTLEVYDTIRMAQYAGDDRVDQQICYLDDLFSERYRGLLAAGDRYPDVEIQPLGNFAAHVPGPLRTLADNRRSQRALLRLEARMAQRSEDRAARRFRRSLLVNAGEADRLARRSAAGDVVGVVPPLVALPERRSRAFAGRADFVFLGLLSLPHNDDGLRSFLTDVWPLVLAHRPDARLRVFGREPSSALLALVTRFADSVTLEGYVADLSEVLGAAAALVNPLRFGSGVKLKVIEALARALPVVSTTVGADGFATGMGNGVPVADSATEFADVMLELTGQRCNAEASAGAVAHFDACFSRAAVFARYDEAFDLR
jgi:glycosyltransferase involved in cell wall biosynthesis